MLTPRERLLLDCLRSDPMASQDAIAAELGMSRSAVAVHITNLRNKGAIRGRAYVINEGPYVACIGGAMVDISGRPDKPLSRAESNPGRVSLSPGGVARNVAANLVRLGVDCRLISAVGDDSHGDYLMRTTRTPGLDVSGVTRVPGQRTASYVSVLNHRGGLDAGVSDMDVMQFVDSNWLLAHAAAIGNAGAIVIDANLEAEALGLLFERFGDKTIIADPVSVAKATRLTPYLPHIDILKPTLTEAGALIGRPIRSRRQAGAAARALLDKGVKQVFVSLGEYGVHAADSTTATPVAATPVADNRSVTGAGDAFVAGLVSAHLQNASLVRAAGYANDVAGAALRSTDVAGDAQALRELARRFKEEQKQHA